MTATSPLAWTGAANASTPVRSPRMALPMRIEPVLTAVGFGLSVVVGWVVVGRVGRQALATSAATIAPRLSFAREVNRTIAPGSSRRKGGEPILALHNRRFLSQKRYTAARARQAQRGGTVSSASVGEGFVPRDITLGLAGKRRWPYGVE